MHEPELLVLDEPTSGLDPLVQQEFHGMLRDAKAAGQTVFLSSHVLSEVQQTADHVAILRDGRIVKQSSVAALREAALRRVRVVVEESQAPSARAALDQVTGLGELTAQPDREGAVAITAVLNSHVDAFVKAVATLDVVDLTIEEPDLEEAVLGFYGIEEER